MLKFRKKSKISAQIRKFLEPIHDKHTELCLLAERSFLYELDGSCRTPIGGLAQIIGNMIIFKGEILKPDGSKSHKGTWKGNVSDASYIGKNAGKILKEKGGESFFE